MKLSVKIDFFFEKIAHDAESESKVAASFSAQVLNFFLLTCLNLSNSTLMLRQSSCSGTDLSYFQKCFREVSEITDLSSFQKCFRKVSERFQILQTWSPFRNVWEDELPFSPPALWFFVLENESHDLKRSTE